MQGNFFFRIESIVRLAILLLFLGSSVPLAESTFGTILGTLRDSSGALMPDVVITIEHTGTSFRRSTMADEAASYLFPNLEPGTYKVTMMAPGFQVAEYTNIQLLARQTIRIDGQMTVASQTETVSVVCDLLGGTNRCF
jgi:Carboxypeptidase regulatory-like domain